MNERPDLSVVGVPNKLRLLHSQKMFSYSAFFPPSLTVVSRQFIFIQKSSLSRLSFPVSALCLLLRPCGDSPVSKVPVFPIFSLLFVLLLPTHRPPPSPSDLAPCVSSYLDGLAVLHLCYYSWQAAIPTPWYLVPLRVFLCQ